MGFKLDVKTIAIIVLFLLLLIGGWYHFNKTGKLEDQHDLDIKLQRALTDTLHQFKNDKGQWVSEKLTLQLDLDDLKKKNLTLTQSQKDLLDAVKKVNKDNQVITAALIEMGIKIDKWKDDKPVEVTDSTVRFATDTDSIKYDIFVSNVKPVDLKIPKLEFRKFEMPNTQFIEFHWKDNKKEGYPISFSVTNSNPLYKVYDINSYAIEGLDKNKIDPTWWQKFKNSTKSTTGRAILFGAGVAVGILLAK
jgi:FtsZ-binding cell division protein ZapB